VEALEKMNGTKGELPGRHTAVFSIVWEEWDEKRPKVVAEMERTQEDQGRAMLIELMVQLTSAVSCKPKVSLSRQNYQEGNRFTNAARKNYSRLLGSPDTHKTSSMCQKDRHTGSNSPATSGCFSGVK
jgi:hypothetical protein